MPRYLLDTNVLSALTKPVPNERVLKRFRRHELHVATTSLVWNELFFGYLRLLPSKRRETLGQFLEQVLRPALLVLPYDSAAAEWHALERARLEKAGSIPPFIDGQIAAIAHVNDLVLVTADRKDYALFEGLTIEDWRS
ncbi:MAG: type II toxin-antitoxin system VapC family toxin [Candidatus Riflebacteria bacterium]|nr:type II toxin-antitoxin system VapC family toxin [Candidatus Riflebacteria bacterium]